MLQDFISNIQAKGGLVKSNRFKVFISLPGRGEDETQDLSLLCESTELPGKTLTTADVKVYGPTYKIPYQKQYSEITFTFLSTIVGEEKLLFDSWIESIMPNETNNMRFPRGINGLNDGYLTDIRIEQYNDLDLGKVQLMPQKRVQLIDAFPLGYAAQPLNWGDDGFLRFSVQFSYRSFVFY